jgi:hypothetical protein
VQNCTSNVHFNLLDLRTRMRFCTQFASISVQNMPLDGEVGGGRCEAYAGTKTAFFYLETLFNPTTLAGELDGQDRRRRNENGERERS